jgi:hypothetical protein
MPITVAELTSNYDNTDSTSYTTASITPVANRLYLLFSFTSGTNPQITGVSGGGLGSWVDDADNLGAGRSIQVFRALSPSPGAAATVSITCAASNTGCAWGILELTGVDTSGTNGSGAVVQRVQNNGTATSGSATLAAYADGNSRFVGACGSASNENITAENTGGTARFAASPNTNFLTQWSTTVQDTTPTWNWTTSGAWRTLALEIRTPAAAPTGFTGWGVPIFFDRVRDLFLPRNHDKLWVPRRREVLV